MLEEIFSEVYTKFKMHFYRQVFQRIGSRETSLTTVEMFCMEGIAALGEPTIAEFSQFMGISTPNAAYKVNNLVQKGYVERLQSPYDRREYHLRPTEKYSVYQSISFSYLHTVLERAQKRFTPEETAELERMLGIINDEMMSEMSPHHKKRTGD